jgi:colanic acid biosynthesis glycosyl transferase WcaI
MHFVFLNQFYPPDVLPTGVVLEAVAAELVAQGHEVTVVSGRSSRQEGSGAHAPPRFLPGTAPEAVREHLEKGQTAGGLAPFGTAFGWGLAPEAPGGGLESTLENGTDAGSEVRVVRLRALGWGRKKSALGKLLAYASYYAGVGWWLLAARWRHRADVIVALTTPPYLSLLARMGAGWHGGRHAHWVMDLYPDVMVAHGMLREGGLGDKILAGLARWGMGGRRAGPVLTLGPDMADRLDRYLEDGRKAAWVPLWGTAQGGADDREVAVLRQHRGWEPDTVVFLYSGNMGLGHRFTEVIAALPRLGSGHPERSIHLAFYGGGKRHGEIKAALAAGEVGGLARVEPNSAGTSSPPVHAGSAGGGPGLEVTLSGFPSSPRATDVCQPVPGNAGFSLHGYVPQEQLAAHLASGDVHLASLDPAWDGMMVPSKLQGIFEAGRPVLFTGSRTCSIGRWILESGGGWVCAPDDVAAHVQAMREALDPLERKKRGAAARAFAAQGFDRVKNVKRIGGVLVEGG